MIYTLINYNPLKIIIKKFNIILLYNHMLNIIFVSSILLAECLKPIIDSTRNIYSSRDIADFEKKFSVWFSIKIEGSLIKEIFSITQF